VLLGSLATAWPTARETGELVSTHAAPDIPLFARAAGPRMKSSTRYRKRIAIRAASTWSYVVLTVSPGATQRDAAAELGGVSVLRGRRTL
jgi:hypothetical protein